MLKANNKLPAVAESKMGTNVKYPFKVAVIGCGRIGILQHIPSLLKIKGVEIAAICDKDKDLVRRIANRFNISSYYNNFSEMLSRNKVNMVDICTPPQTHTDLAIQAIEASCHVLVEKPMAMTVKEVDKIKHTAEHNGVKVCQVHNKLYEPVMIKALNTVNRGRIGDLKGVDIQVLHSYSSVYTKLRDREHWCHSLPAGIFTETLPHPIYLASAFLGKLKPVAVTIGNLNNYDFVSADEIRIIFEGDKGAGTISFSSSSPKSKTIIDIHGTKSHLRIDLLNSAMYEYGRGTDTLMSRGIENLGQSIDVTIKTIATSMKVISGNFHSGHYTLIQRFIKSIQNNTEQPVSWREARHVIEVLEQITSHL